MRKRTVIQVSSVSKSYGSNQAVEEVSFRVKEGELFGIIGTNGAGKTTLLEMLMGLRKPDNGRIDVLGIDAIMEAEKLKDYIGIYLQSTSLVDKLTLREALEMFQSFYTRKMDLDELIGRFGLEPFENKIVKRLSGGCQEAGSSAPHLQSHL
ncbi:ATP-binding cassette domain-containing protein [Paenibacillus radicis (ex Gao et al. 2016)]|uniref:ABC transporter domain-containing protein n=1 Tax=Paenibacillus radicis (ex Gao et al. 2016) TaxID=1737354 RepID=A0A917HKR0_9BACL|nr:ABC transporter ATP-binding protein [Paenibacillus radicis (ex Gao et al. 2016)]GGG82316.1 hypothetical protein GCM10010918_44620 [Paenibacillus radicis (ex Gao et al. 2016)]